MQITIEQEEKWKRVRQRINKSKARCIIAGDFAMIFLSLGLSFIFANVIFTQIFNPYYIPESTNDENRGEKAFDFAFLLLTYAFYGVYLFRLSILDRTTYRFLIMRNIFCFCIPFMLFGALLYAVAEACNLDDEFLRMCLQYTPFLIATYIAAVAVMLILIVWLVFYISRIVKEVATHEANIDLIFDLYQEIHAELLKKGDKKTIKMVVA